MFAGDHSEIAHLGCYIDNRGHPPAVENQLPDKKTNPDVLLPLLRNLHQMAEDLAVKDVVAKGGKINCTKGCGVRCRKLVPIT